MDSDKTKKFENEKFVRDDTFYVIYGNNNIDSNKKRKLKSLNIKINFNEVNIPYRIMLDKIKKL